MPTTASTVKQRPAARTTSMSVHQQLEQLLRMGIADGSLSLPPDQTSIDFCVVRIGGLQVSIQLRREQKDEEVMLTPRESEIARLIATGNPDKVIAATLRISKFTVSTYIRRIFAKLGVSTRAAMVHRLKDQWP